VTLHRDESIRRLRLGDLRRLLRSRYGIILPDDDAGRDDLQELLLPISLGAHGDCSKMRNVIEVWAPWMGTDEAEKLIDRVSQMPDYQRKPSAKELGERMNLTAQEREACGIRTIRPAGMTDEALAERRRAKDRARKQRKRRAAGMRSRTTYLAGSLSKTKPWKAEGISERTWYRKRHCQIGRGVSAIKLSSTEDRVLPSNVRCQAEPELPASSKWQGSKKESKSAAGSSRPAARARTASPSFVEAQQARKKARFRPAGGDSNRK
jgi:hypothetical protein